MTRSSAQRPNIRRTAPAGRWPGWTRRAVLAAGVVLVGGLACGEDATGPAPPPPPPPPPPPVATTVAVSPAAARLLSVGETAQLSAEVRDQNGRAMPGATVTWTSSDPSVVTVDASGLVTAAGDGTATVTAASGSASGSATVTVEQSTERVTVTPDSAALLVGDTVRLSATAFDALGSEVAGASFAWSSGDTLVAEVDASGLVRGLGPGRATVSASSGTASGTALVSVEQSTERVTVTPDSAALLVGDTVRLSAAAFDALDNEVAGASFTWSSGDTLVATVDSTGLATGIATGAVEITATSSDVEGRARLVVAVAAPTTVAVTPDSVRLMALGDTIRLSAEVLDQVGRPMPGAAVEWSSGDPAVASVDSTGLVRAEGSGATTVTATSGSAAGSASVSIMQSVSSVTVTPAEASIGPGDTLRLAAKALDANGHPVAGAEFSWSSSDESVATVDASGLVRGVVEGGAVITAAAGEVRGTAEITVENPDRAALVALYEATDGPNWVDNTNWLTDAPLEDWYGVDTDADGRVVRLNLSGTWDDDAREFVPHGLLGPIPPEVGGLTNLRQLHLGTNDLTGPIPPELGSLANLRWLGLDLNNLSGPIPPELGDLANLWWLVLDRNNLSGPIPPELGGLASLELLNLGENALSGPIPLELGGLANLRGLLLYRNNLSGPIPPELGGLASLETLHLGENTLSGPIPPELGGLANLSWLDLHFNNLSGPIPPELGGLANLSWLDLHLNNLSGPIPPELVELEGLESLILNETDVCAPGVVRFVRWIDGMETFSGSYCNELDVAVLDALHAATGGRDWTNSEGWRGGPALEEWYGVSADSLGRVTGLDLRRNGLVGRLPGSLGDLDRMVSLKMSGNALSGWLPPRLIGLSLDALEYEETELCAPPDDEFRAWLGAIPSHSGTGEVCAVTDRHVLEALYDGMDGPNWTRSDNWLTDAPLGDWYGIEADEAGRVITMNLNLNGLIGRLPPELGRLSELRELILRSRSLQGEIPSELGKLAKLEVLDLWGGRFGGLEGGIPAELWNLTELRRLDLGYNQLSIGEIPPGVGNLTELRFLSLLSDGVTGEIAPEIGKLSKLTHLYLGYNALRGEIPRELWTLPSLRILHLDGNNLEGEIPPDVVGLPRLIRLFLGDNRFRGRIPAEIGTLSELLDLHLGGNPLEGPLPAELFSLPSLGTLDLSGIGLAGPLPAGIGNLRYLRELVLAENAFSGPVPPWFGDLAELETLDLSFNPELSGPLPESVTGLALTGLLTQGTGLCAPGDLAFQNWLLSIERQRVRACGSGTEGEQRPYLVQAVQSPEYPVTLVAGRSALFRAFVTAPVETSETLPPVRVSFFVNGMPTHVEEIPAGAATIPTEVWEGSLDRSVNAEIPGDVIRPGLEMVVDVDPDGTVDPALGVSERIPEEGRLSVPVRVMPGLDLTLVPFIWTGNNDRGTADLVRELHAEHDLFWESNHLLPIGDLDIAKHAPVVIDSNDAIDMGTEVSRIRSIEGGTGHWLGLLDATAGSINGVALGIPSKVSFSVTDPRVIAHELGHNLNLFHAPCGGAAGPDPAFPSPEGETGSWGYDPRDEGSMVSPEYFDLMSYCRPHWISDYHFSRVLRFWFAAAAAAEAPVATQSLLVSGRLTADSTLSLDPAFVVEAPPVMPSGTGPYSLSGVGADGTVVFSFAFDMEDVVDGDGSSTFMFAIPAAAGWESELASLVLSGPGGEVEMREGSEPPMVILRDPGTGEVRAILRNPPSLADGSLARSALDALAPEPGLDVLLSRGIPDAAAWRR